MKEVLGNEKVFCNLPGLIDDVNIGGTILVDDGYLELTVIDKGEDEEGKYILTRARNTHR